MNKKLYIRLTIGCIVVCLCSYCIWYFLNVVQPKQQAITSLKTGKYTEALSKLNKSLSAHSNSETISLKILAEDCIKLDDNYNNNNFPSVVLVYDTIKENPNFDLVSTYINKIYTIAKKKPNLILRYENGSDCNEKLVFSNNSEKFGNMYVLTNAGLANTIKFELLNTGVDPAEAVVADFKFNNMYINGDFANSKLVGVSHEHGMGWTELKYSINNELLYSGIPQQFTLDFNCSMIGSNASITIILLAKDCTPKKFDIPVEIKK